VSAFQGSEHCGSHRLNLVQGVSVKGGGPESKRPDFQKRS
jgi:hypothetical protein